jgi:hypothetical protein
MLRLGLGGTFSRMFRRYTEPVSSNEMEGAGAVRAQETPAGMMGSA